MRVTLFEKNDALGGRARKFIAEGFTFDMGPSWYWMPEVFEDFFQLFGHRASDFYELTRLNPSYRVFFGKDDFVDLPADREELFALVESLEPGGAGKLQSFLDDAARKYRIGMGDFVFRPGLSVTEFMELRLLREAFRLNLFRSMSTHVRRYFSNPRLLRILEFPVIFLGASPSETPAMYSLMNHADMTLGTWYPKGGMWRIVEAMEKICREQGVDIRTGAAVQRVNVKNGRAVSITADGTEHPCDAVLASADYHHVERQLLTPEHRTYSPKYWDTRQMSPSCLLFFVGLNSRVPDLLHHTLFFDREMDAHMAQIYEQPQWPTDPLFYVCCPSQTDPTVAPEGRENLFILIPVAAGLDDSSEEVRERYFDMVMSRIEALTGRPLRKDVVFRQSYAHRDFTDDYNAFRGNAFGLANTLSQTALLKPRLRSDKVKNLFFAGQLTVPGPGVPPALISGQMAAREIVKAHG